jgi:hypothetical protein
MPASAILTWAAKNPSAANDVIARGVHHTDFRVFSSIASRDQIRCTQLKVRRTESRSPNVADGKRHNLLLQIRGSKTIHVGERSFVTERELERFFTGGHRNVSLPEELGEKCGTRRKARGARVMRAVRPSDSLCEHTLR